MGAVYASDIRIMSDSITGYVILTGANPAECERKASEVLREYIYRASGTRLDIISKDNYTGSHYIRLKNISDNTNKQGYKIINEGGNLHFTGYGKKGVLYAVYTFIEKVLGAKKLAPGEPAIVPVNLNIRIEDNLLIEEYPHFLYREVYSLAEIDPEYLDWHKLNTIDDTWGLWGHSVFKLVQPGIYWEKHPEYYSLYNGRRQPLQLCLTNPEVLDIASNTLQQMMDNNPHAELWSVSVNDNLAVCECDHCTLINNEEGSASGTLIRFVNSLAKRFPQKKFATLAYQSTSWPSLLTKPERNVYIMLSSIGIYRSEPIPAAESAKSFRHKLSAWRKLTPNVLIWDYYTQFTNLLAPFPVEHTFSGNLKYLHQQETYGVFAQMNEFTYGDMLELKMYMLAKLMWNSALDEEKLVFEFLDSYYMEAAPYVKDYLDKRKQAIKETGVNLDIYGNPVNNQHDYLSPEWMDSYSNSLDKAEKAADTPVVSERIKRLRLPLEFTYLQQARSYGIHPHGIWHENTEGKLEVNENIRKKIDHLYSFFNSIGIKNISEDGVTLEEYKAEWDSVLQTVPAVNLAAGATISLRYPYVQDYAAKGIRTLNDRLSGYKDLSYNWLIFDGVALDAVIDMDGTRVVNTIVMNFLENQRLWIYKPESIRIYASNDNVAFKQLDSHKVESPHENYDIGRYQYIFNFDAGEGYRYIRVVAEPLSYNPVWSPPTYSRKPMIACDEIWVK